MSCFSFICVLRKLVWHFEPLNLSQFITQRYFCEETKYQTFELYGSWQWTYCAVFNASSSTNSSQFELVTVLQFQENETSKNHPLARTTKFFILQQVACSKDFDLTLQDVEMESLEVWEFNWGIDKLLFVDELLWLWSVGVKCPVDTTRWTWRGEMVGVKLLKRCMSWYVMGRGNVQCVVELHWKHWRVKLQWVHPGIIFADML